MSTYTIGEIAERSGFSASSLRYYEAIGLVVPSARTAAGYRVYGDHTLARLAFIARAKQVGCSLEEITDLVGIWDGERCGPVQHRFHELVTAKIADTQRQILDLTALTVQLRQAAALLSGPATDGPCGEDCACLATIASATTDPVPVSPVARREAPIACTLTADAMPVRQAEWEDALAQAVTRIRTTDGALRVAFDPTVDIGELARLVAAEQHCCAFFEFALTVDDRGVALEVRAPDGADAIVDGLFGAASNRG